MQTVSVSRVINITALSLGHTITWIVFEYFSTLTFKRELYFLLFHMQTRWLKVWEWHICTCCENLSIRLLPLIWFRVTGADKPRPPSLPTTSSSSSMGTPELLTQEMPIIVVLVRWLNPLSWLLSVWRRSISALSPSQMTPQLTCVCETSYPSEKANFHCLHLWSDSFGHYPELLIIEAEGRSTKFTATLLCAALFTPTDRCSICSRWDV